MCECPEALARSAKVHSEHSNTSSSDCSRVAERSSPFFIAEADTNVKAARKKNLQCNAFNQLLMVLRSTRAIIARLEACPRNAIFDSQRSIAIYYFMDYSWRDNSNLIASLVDFTVALNPAMNLIAFNAAIFTCFASFRRIERCIKRWNHSDLTHSAPYGHVRMCQDASRNN